MDCTPLGTQFFDCLLPFMFYIIRASASGDALRLEAVVFWVICVIFVLCELLLVTRFMFGRKAESLLEP